MCSLDDDLNLSVSLRPRLVKLDRCHCTSGTRSLCAGISGKRSEDDQLLATQVVPLDEKIQTFIITFHHMFLSFDDRFWMYR